MSNPSLSQLKLLYEKCNKNPKHCHFDAEDQFEYSDSSKSFNEMDTNSLLDYMKENLGELSLSVFILKSVLGACEWGAYHRLKTGNKTGCPQDRDFFDES